jgi:hypothetical protein
MPELVLLRLSKAEVPAAAEREVRGEASPTVTSAEGGIVLKNSKIGPLKKHAKLKSEGPSPLDSISVLLRTSHAA